MNVSHSHRIVLIFLDEYKYATGSTYSPTASEKSPNGELRTRLSPSHHANVE